MKPSRKKLLEQIYYCDFLPSESIHSYDPEYLPACKKMDEEITFISQRLSDADQEHFDKLISLLSDTSNMTDCDNFIYGLRTGALLMHEIMTP